MDGKCPYVGIGGWKSSENDDTRGLWSKKCQQIFSFSLSPQELALLGPEGWKSVLKWERKKNSKMETGMSRILLQYHCDRSEEGGRGLGLSMSNALQVKTIVSQKIVKKVYLKWKLLVLRIVYSNKNYKFYLIVSLILTYKYSESCIVQSSLKQIFSHLMWIWQLSTFIECENKIKQVFFISTLRELIALETVVRLQIFPVTFYLVPNC